MGKYDLSAGEKAELSAVFGEGEIGYSYGHEPKPDPMDWVFNEWAHGRQVMGSGYVPPIVSPTRYWLDGTPMPNHPTTHAEWDALVAEHGLNPAHFAENRGVTDDEDDEAGD